MKKILAILICICILIFSLVACCGPNTAEATTEKYNRLSVIEDARLRSNDFAFILVDNKTGVCYLYTEGIECCAVTVMVDSNGKPLLWEEES